MDSAARFIWTSFLNIRQLKCGPRDAKSFPKSQELNCLNLAAQFFLEFLWEHACRFLCMLLLDQSNIFINRKCKFFLKGFSLYGFIQEQRDSEWRRGLCVDSLSHLCLRTPEGKEIA